MGIELYLVIVIITFVALYFVVPPLIGAYLKYRGAMVITCPETRRPAAVKVDVKHAAVTSMLGEPHLQLKDCSRWPERKDCGQECLLQIELSPEDCMVRVMLTKWYEEKSCAFCGKPFAQIHLLDHKPALMTTEGRIIEWSDIRPETLPDLLATHKPVCWDCSIAESFRLQHPELVVDRPWKDGAYAERK